MIHSFRKYFETYRKKAGRSSVKTYVHRFDLVRWWVEFFFTDKESLTLQYIVARDLQLPLERVQLTIRYAVEGTAIQQENRAIPRSCA